MYDLSEKEEKIIELIEKSPKSFKELNELGGDLLKSEATLSRLLKNLEKLNLIESFQVKEPHTRIKKRYRLTEEYYKKKEIEQKTTQFSKMIVSRLNWQNVFNKMRYYLEFEYPILFQKSTLLNSNEVYGDIFSYLVFFNLNNEVISGDSKKYFDLMLYLITHHPDKKYESFGKNLKLKVNNFLDLIKNFKEVKKLEEFQFIDPLTSLQSKFYIISDDPIIFRLRQQVNTYFLKFLLCWQFPDVSLEHNFDFIFQFSHFILEELKSFYLNKEDENILEFIFNNRICLLIYIREYILEFLEKIKIEGKSNENFIEFPLELLPNRQKESYRSELILTPEILTSKEQNYLENCFKSFKKSRVESLKLLKEFIKKLTKKIEKYMENPYKSEEVLYLKSHLILLIRIFYHIDKFAYKSFKKEFNTRCNQIKLSYSKLSEEIFESILNSSIGLEVSSESNKRSFVIRQFLERIDHLLKKLKKYDNRKEEFTEKLNKIFLTASSKFSQNLQFSFYKKKCKIFLKGFELYPESEILKILQDLNNSYPQNFEIPVLIFRFLLKNNNVNVVNNLIKNNKWLLSDKILIFEKYVHQIPLEFNIDYYFNLNLEKLRYNFNLFKETDKNLFIKLLKTMAFYVERKNLIDQGFIYYYMATELEQEAFNPLNREIFYKLYPFFDDNIQHLRLRAPAYFNLIRIYSEYKDVLFKEKIKFPVFIQTISKFLYNIKVGKKFENIINYLPNLMSGLTKISKFFEINLDFNQLLKSQKEGEKGISSFKHQIIKIRKELSSEEKELLKKIKSIFNDFAKNTNTPAFWGLIFNIDEILKGKTKLFQKFTSNQFLKNISFESSNLPLFQSFINLGIYKSIFGIDLNKNFTPLNFFMLNNIIMNKAIKSEVNIQRFDVIEKIFVNKNDNSFYDFNLAFSKKYSVPQNQSLNFWDNLIEYLNSDPLRLIELLDIYLYHNNLFTDFEKLEKLLEIILKHYGINWTLRYLDNFMKYIRWYNERLENPTAIVYPYTLGNENIFKIFDFCSNIIKASIYWEYRDRYRAQEFVNNAFNIFENFKKIKSELLKTDLLLNDYYKKLLNLRNKLLEYR